MTQHSPGEWHAFAKYSIGDVLTSERTSFTVRLGVNDASGLDGRPHSWVALAFRLAWRNWYLSMKNGYSWGVTGPFRWGEPCKEDFDRATVLRAKYIRIMEGSHE